MQVVATGPVEVNPTLYDRSRRKPWFRGDSKVYERDGGTVKLLGNAIRVSPLVILPASYAPDMVFANVLGVNLEVLTVKFWLLAVGL
jgi:hypothetical protein